MLELITSTNWLRWLPGKPGCCSRAILVCACFTPCFGINYLGQKASVVAKNNPHGLIQLLSLEAFKELLPSARTS